MRFVRSLILIAAAGGLSLTGCSGRGASSALPPQAQAAQKATLPTVSSVSPATIAVAPMAQSAVRPASEMSARTPQSAVQQLGWTQIPGGAIDVAASPDGSIWVLSSVGSGPDRGIWHYANGAWTNIPGAASRLAAAPDNSLWVINSAGGIYHYANGGWTAVAGGAADITVASDGSIYVISNQGGGPYGRGIWHYSNGTWTQMPGAGVRIAASWDTGTYPNNVVPGGFWVTNAAQSIYYFNPTSGFYQIPGAAAALAPGKNGGLFVLGVPLGGSGYPIYYNDLSTGAWSPQPGAAISIATDGTQRVWVVGAAGGIYYSAIAAPGPQPTQPPSIGAAPAAGYLAATPTGSFAGQLTATHVQATVVAISTADGTTAPGVLTPDTLAFNVGSTALSTGRAPQAAAVDTSGPHAPVERAVEGPQQIAALTSRLTAVAPGARTPMSTRHTQTLGTTVGSHASFWINTFAIGSSSGSYLQLPATLQAVTANGYVWVDDSLIGTSATLPSSIAQMATDLDNAYASDTAHYGPTAFSATSPGVAGRAYAACDSTGAPTGGSVPAWVVPSDGKVNALVVNEGNLGAGVGGYFSSNNYLYQSALNCLIGQTPAGGGAPYTAATIPHSNEAPLIYVGWLESNGPDFEAREDIVRGTAHELQHLINFVNHTPLHNGKSEDAWLNEGLSMLAQDFAVQRLFGIPHDAADALYHANHASGNAAHYSLTAFTGIDPMEFTPAYNCEGCYGMEYLFQRYLYDRFGGDAYLHSMLGSSASYANLQQATATDPKSLISDFAIALAASGTNTTTDPRFTIGSLSLKTRYPDQFGSGRTVGSPGSGPLSSVATPFIGTFAYYNIGPSALNQTLSAKDTGGAFSLKVGVVQQ